jgi:hypothetical protein
MSDPNTQQDATLVAPVGKNALIEVPDYDATADGNQTSYIRLGHFTVDDMTKPERGSDLVEAVLQVGPSDGWSDSPGPRVFEDDWRKRPIDVGVSGATDMTQDDRQARSAALTNKQTPTAGWRDHTQGDRITTTRGDKLEVIGGNYKLVVMGRTGDPTQSSGLDFSGGLFQDFDAAPGTINEIRWVQDGSDGTWKIFEKATKGIVHSLYSGDVTEEFYGSTITTIIGSSGAAQVSEAGLENPDRAMMKVDGDDLKNPTIVEKIWAKEITSATKAPKMTESLDVTELATSVTAKNLTETYNVSGAWDVRTISGESWSDFAQATRVYRTLLGELVVDVLMAKGMVAELFLGPVHATADISAVAMTLGTGIGLDVSIGAKAEILLGFYRTIKLKEYEDIVLRKTQTAVTSTTTSATSTISAATATLSAVTVNVTGANVAVGAGAPPPPPPPAPPITL